MLTLATDTLDAVIGTDAAARLAATYGGSEWYIPAKWHRGHQLVAVIGAANAEKLSRHMAGETLAIPTGAARKREIRNTELRRRFIAGESSRALALEYGLSQRMVRYILSKPVPPGSKSK